MSDLHQQLTELLAKGDKIAAIQLLRAHFALGLADAKAAIERFEAGEGLPQARSATEGEDLPEDVRELASQGRKLEAIKLLRERSGMDLALAKRRVDAVAGAGAKKSGCAGGLLCVLLVGACLLTLL